MFLYAQEVCTDFMLLKNTFEKDKEVALKAKSVFKAGAQRKKTVMCNHCPSLEICHHAMPLNVFNLI